ALFGGTAPLVATFLIGWSGNVLTQVFYLSFCATVSLAIMFPLRDRAPAQAASPEAARQEALISLDP
ncbi:MAG: MFS transporter, partial [Nitrospirota bacterium]